MFIEHFSLRGGGGLTVNLGHVFEIINGGALIFGIENPFNKTIPIVSCCDLDFLTCIKIWCYCLHRG